MPNDQPAAPAAESASIETRLAAVLGGPATIPVPVQEPVEPPAAESDQTPEGAVESADEGTDESSIAPDVEEVELDGEKFQVPAKLKPALMMQADYTRKTQELAEIRKALEAERFTAQVNAAFAQKVQPLLAKHNELLSYKEQAKKIDWTALTTDQKIDLDRELRNIDVQLNELGGALRSQQEQHNQQVGSAVLNAVASSEQFMAQKVPGWDQAAGNELHNYGMWLGIPKERLTTGWFSDPLATHIMWKAKEWDKLQLGKPQIANRASNAPPVVKPGSNAAQGSLASSKYQQARAQLKKSGSVDDAAAVFLRMK